MSRKSRPSKGFTCINCRRSVDSTSSGTRHRNHCPWCLFSRHLDESPGDRRSACGGLMEPIALEVREGSEWAIVHRCRGCKTLRANRIAGDDHELALLVLALRPLSNPPFPLECLNPFVFPR